MFRLTPSATSLAFNVPVAAVVLLLLVWRLVVLMARYNYLISQVLISLLLVACGVSWNQTLATRPVNQKQDSRNISQ